MTNNLTTFISYKLYDLYDLLHIDYLFNSQRSLSNIKQNNGNELIKLNGFLSKKQINDLYYNNDNDNDNDKYYIFLDYSNLYKKYIISYYYKFNNLLDLKNKLD